jgi:hypothetical protein
MEKIKNIIQLLKDEIGKQDRDSQTIQEIMFHKLHNHKEHEKCNTRLVVKRTILSGLYGYNNSDYENNGTINNFLKLEIYEASPLRNYKRQTTQYHTYDPNLLSLQ